MPPLQPTFIAQPHAQFAVLFKIGQIRIQQLSRLVGFDRLLKLVE